MSGKNLIVLVGEQDNKGVEPASYKRLNVTSCSLGEKVTTIQSQALNGNRFTDETYVSSFDPSGSITVEVDTDTLGILLKHAIGAVENTGVDPDYSHSFKPPKDTAPLDQLWLTFIVFKSDKGTGKKFKDCQINSFGLDVTPQSLITANLDILGITGERINVLPAFLEPTGQPLFAWDMLLQLDGQDTSAILNDFKLTHNNNRKSDDYGLLRNRRGMEPQEGEHKIDFTLKFTKLIYESLDEDLKANNIIPLVATIGPLTITYPKPKLTEVNDPVNGPGEVTISASARALWDNATDMNVEFNLDNNVAAY